MRTYLMIANFIGLFCILIVFDILYSQIEKYEQNYNDERLSKSVEYATEAAFLFSAGANDDDITYMDTVSVSLNSQDTLEIFDTMMELSYNLALSDESDCLIEDSIGAAVLAGNDGYYMSNLCQNEKEEMRLFWSPKLPYSAEIGDSTYSVCLNTTNWIQTTCNSATGKIKVNRGEKYSDAYVAGILTTERAKSIISTKLTNVISRALDDNSLYRGDSEVNLYIPSKQTISGINAIESPSLIIILRDADYAGCKGTQNAMITGLKVVPKIRVIGYVDISGKKKYSYEFQGASRVYHVDEYFDSVEEACLAGYLPDYNYICNTK